MQQTMVSRKGLYSSTPVTEIVVSLKINTNNRLFFSLYDKMLRFFSGAFFYVLNTHLIC